MRAEREDGEQQRPVDVVVESSFEHVSWPWRTRDAACASRVPAAARRASARGGSGRPSCLAKNVSSTCLAIGAAVTPPWPPCSTNTTPAICGLSRGAKNTNQPLSRRSLSVLPLAACAPSSEITCAVPVLPDTSRPAIRASPPVPVPFTTIHRPSRIA